MNRPTFVNAMIGLAGIFFVTATPCESAPQSGPAGKDSAADQLLVKVAASVAVRHSGPADAATLGVAAIDEVAARLGVTAMRPLSPAGAKHKDPAAFHELGLDRVWRFTLPSGADLEGAARRLATLREVEYATAPRRVELFKVPDDTKWSKQWNLMNGKLNCPKAWDVITDSSAVPIGVLDTGADMSHTDFQANRWTNVNEIANNGIDDDHNGYIDDYHGYDFVNRDQHADDDNGHGTHVSGILGAIGNNSQDVAGICWTAAVMSLKVLDANGSGYLSDAAEGLTYAADNGALVANMSFGTSTDDSTMAAAVSYAASADVLEVAAAGNNGDTTKQYPAAYSDVMAVIATDENDNKWSGSTYGDWCDISAPGTNIVSLKLGGGTTTLTGTSMASPHVAGVAALCRALNPAMGHGVTNEVLRYSALDLGTGGFDNSFAWGRLDCERAVKMSRALTAPSKSMSSGSKLDFALTYPEDAGFFYVLLPTTQGRDPGISLNGFDPADFRFVPVNPDPLQLWVISNPNNGIFLNFIGSLDSMGNATATFNVPKHLFAGQTVTFAFVTIDPANTTHVAHISDPMPIAVK